MNTIKKLLLAIIIFTAMVIEGIILFLAYVGICCFFGAIDEDAEFAGEWLARGEKRFKDRIRKKLSSK